MDDNTIELETDLTIALDATTDYVVFSLWNAAQSNTAENGLGAIGFAQVAVLINEYFWAQTKGLGVVALDTSADGPLVPGEKFVASDDAGGKVKGFVAAATTADEAAQTLGTAIIDAASDIPVPALIDVSP